MNFETNFGEEPKDSEFFQKQTDEDLPIEISEEMTIKYAKLNKIFDTFFAENSLSLAKESSKEERDQKSINDSSFVYGEVVNI